MVVLFFLHSPSHHSAGAVEPHDTGHVPGPCSGSIPGVSTKAGAWGGMSVWSLFAVCTFTCVMCNIPVSGFGFHPDIFIGGGGGALYTPVLLHIAHL